jgi:RimJ/RimL family protein N-acetyltransferase
VSDVDPNATLPPYRVQTERLVLRPWRPSEVHVLIALVRGSLDRLKPWFPWAQEVPSVDHQMAWIRKVRAFYDTDVDYPLGMFLRDGTAIGGTGIHLRQGAGTAEFGYWIATPWERQGFVTESTAGLTRLALTVMGFERAYIRCDSINERSSAIPKRLGYRLVRTDIEQCTQGDTEQWVDTYELLQDELAGSPSAGAKVWAWDGAGRRMH